MSKITEQTRPAVIARSPEAREGRRPYTPPRIVERQSIESIAADCSLPGGKNDPTCIIGFS